MGAAVTEAALIVMVAVVAVVVAATTIETVRREAKTRVEVKTFSVETMIVVTIEDPGRIIKVMDSGVEEVPLSRDVATAAVTEKKVEMAEVMAVTVLGKEETEASKMIHVENRDPSEVEVVDRMEETSSHAPAPATSVEKKATYRETVPSRVRTTEVDTVVARGEAPVVEAKDETLEEIEEAADHLVAA